MTLQEDDILGRGPHMRTTTQKEDNLTGRETLKKLRSEEDKRRRKKGSQAGNLPGR